VAVYAMYATTLAEMDRVGEPKVVPRAAPRGLPPMSDRRSTPSNRAPGGARAAAARVARRRHDHAMDPGRDAQQTRRRPAIALIVALVVAAVSVAVAVSCGPPEVTAGKADAGDHSSFQRYGRAKGTALPAVLR